jgi:hypothetical protein
MKNARFLLTFSSLLYIFWSSSLLWAQERQELVDRRSHHSKTFRNQDGTFTTEISTGYLHYQNALGEFVEMDRNFRPSSNPNHNFEATAGLYQVFFDKTTNAELPFTFRLRNGAEIKARLTAMAYFDRSNQNYVILNSVSAANPALAGNLLTYQNAFPGVDVKYTYTDRKLKEEIHLSQAARESLPDPASLGFKNDNVYLAFLAQFEVDSTVDAFVNNAKISRKDQTKPRSRVFEYEGEDRVDFKNAGDRVQFFFPVDFAYFNVEVGADSTREKQEKTKVLKRIFSTDEGDFFYFGIPYKWLQKLAPGPVVIDPTIEIQPTLGAGKDTFIYKYYPNSNHGALGQIQIGPDIGTYERRGLLEFNLSVLPPNAIIIQAALQLYLFGTWGTASNFNIEAHQLLKAWTEGSGSTWGNSDAIGCDWNYANQSGAIFWQSPGMGSGTDFNAQILSQTLISLSDDEVWKSWLVTQAVQNWHSGQSNYGLALITKSSDISKYIGAQFYSENYSTNPALSPKLTIVYTVGDLAEYTYNPTGTVDSLLLWNTTGAIGSYQYHNRDWVTDIHFKDGTNQTLFRSTYTHDDAGNILSQNYTNVSGTDNATYTYDDLNRLDLANSNLYNDLDYDYDANGNITQKKINGVAASYVYNVSGKPNRLTQMGSRSFDYDVNGNITGDGTKTLTFDYKNQLTNVNGSVNEEYFYDADGLRLKKKNFVGWFSENFDDGDLYDDDPTTWYTTGSYWDASTGELRWTSTSCIAGQCSNQDLTFDDFEADYDVMADGYCATNYWAAFAFRKTDYDDWYDDSGYDAKSTSQAWFITGITGRSNFTGPVGIWPPARPAKI